MGRRRRSEATPCWIPFEELLLGVPFLEHLEVEALAVGDLALVAYALGCLQAKLLKPIQVHEILAAVPSDHIWLHGHPGSTLWSSEKVECLNCRDTPKACSGHLASIPKWKCLMAILVRSASVSPCR